MNSLSSDRTSLADTNKPLTLRMGKFKSVDHLKRTSTLFNRHRRQNSTNDLGDITENLTLNDMHRKTRSPERKNDTTVGNINGVPEGIRNVDNFESPTRLSLSPTRNDNYRDLSPSRSPSRSPARDSSRSNSSASNPSSRLGNVFSVSPPKYPSILQRKQSSSGFTFSRLRRKISSFMDPEGAKLAAGEPIKGSTPRTPRSGSNSKIDPLVSPLSTENADEHISIGSSNTSTINTKKEVSSRRRSRTLGSLESDLYNKRNGSLVRTIGSMVLLKSTAPSPSNSDEDSLSRPVSPPRATDEDTVDSYLEKLKTEGFEFETTSILSEKNTQFFKDCLYKFLSTKFDFTNESLDISLRRTLVYCELPKEAQHIDRFVECFGRCYYTCNKELWDTADQVYFLTFSFVMLHTDHFNLDNKRRMTKDEFVKNTRVDDPSSNLNNTSIPREVLEYYYDNITYSKFSNFIQQAQSSSRPGSLYMLPKRMFSNSTSHLLEPTVTPSTVSATLANGTALNGQQQQQQQQQNTLQTQPQPHAPLPRTMSISSSTSQFFSLASPAVDPYQYFMNNNLDLLSLQFDDVNYGNPFQDKLTASFPEAEFLKYYRVLKRAEGGTFIRLNKSINWINSKTEVKRVEMENEEFVNTNNYLSNKVLLKIIRVQELYREEVNSKFFTSLGSSTKTYWKPYYGILTTCGFFLFENLNFLTFHERDLISNNESIVIEFPDSALKACLKYSINGLFAVRFEDYESSAVRFYFNLFSTNKREVFSTLSPNDMNSWIISINLVASLDNCLLGFDEFQDHEIVPIRNILIEEKIQKLNKNSNASTNEIDDLLKTVKLLKTLTPFNPKTKDNLIQYFNSLNIRIDWLWYEIERNRVYSKILDKFQQVYRVMETNLGYHEFMTRQLTAVSAHSLGDDDSESILEDSFINEKGGSLVENGLANFDDISTVEFTTQESEDERSIKDIEKEMNRASITIEGFDDQFEADEEQFPENTEFDNELEEFVTSVEHPYHNMFGEDESD
ncbi:hypothetical protein WICPIJ_003406 [Wickerhamomyces pijperi]|uniref:SEC7 domain-containing protein n=1 Tax=Wickerhamomyces pijperi TaxID=599730 RepID=A0A9P8TNQ6_WICPI|nr:hypothetical protein WICPIJ_003406 [Wickerhamomyces pijperi]